MLRIWKIINIFANIPLILFSFSPLFRVVFIFRGGDARCTSPPLNTPLSAPAAAVSSFLASLQSNKNAGFALKQRLPIWFLHYFFFYFYVMFYNAYKHFLCKKAFGKNIWPGTKNNNFAYFGSLGPYARKASVVLVFLGRADVSARPLLRATYAHWYCTVEMWNSYA